MGKDNISQEIRLTLSPQQLTQILAPASLDWSTPHPLASYVGGGKRYTLDSLEAAVQKYIDNYEGGNASQKEDWISKIWIHAVLAPKIYLLRVTVNPYIVYDNLEAADTMSVLPGEVVELLEAVEPHKYHAFVLVQHCVTVEGSTAGLIVDQLWLDKLGRNSILGIPANQDYYHVLLGVRFDTYDSGLSSQLAVIYNSLPDQRFKRVFYTILMDDVERGDY